MAGITTFGTQAAAQYVAEPQYASELLGHLTGSAAGNSQQVSPFYLALVRVKVNGGVPVKLTYVTHHVL